MVTRIESFYSFLNIGIEEKHYGQKIAVTTAIRANGMTHLKDYEALAAIILKLKPKQIFEIGTYLGVTSDFFLEILPQTRVVSIAYPSNYNRIIDKLLLRRFNNTNLSIKEIGSSVDKTRIDRFTQLIGNSHELVAEELIKKFGTFDLVFIDGDHSYKGVKQDTELALKIISDNGIICWHDANPKKRYIDVRIFLEKEISLDILATRDDYVGGIAVWSKEFEKFKDNNH